MDKELGYDLNIAKSLTGIEDEELLKFYINSVILKIERVIGYKLLKAKITSLISGLNTNYVFLPEKKIEQVLNANRGCKMLPFSYINRKIIFYSKMHSKLSKIKLQKII